MQYRGLAAVFVVSAVSCAAQSLDQTVQLIVNRGVPLRVYLTKRLPKKLGAPVHGKLLDPIYAFDREVVPAGSEVLGTVERLDPVSKMARATAILGGDFTPLHVAQVEFTTIVLPDGTNISLHTAANAGLNTLVNLHPKKQRQPQGGGLIAKGKQQVHDQIDTAKQSISDTIRSPNKKELIEDYLWAKLPYHPQTIRNGTRFDAELTEPLQFGAETIKSADLMELGTQPPEDSSVQARLLTPIDSRQSKNGEPIEAVLSRPLFSADHKLVLPEGTHISGAVTMAQRARWLHRGGRLRFNFENIDLPKNIVRPEAAEPVVTRTRAMLQDAEGNGKTPVKVDQEGAVKATEPKTRFIAPAISFLVASRAADRDINKTTGIANNNVAGHTLGGGLGFGLFGAAAAQASRGVAMGFGYYGLAWSVYSNVLSRGSEVTFGKDASIDIRFGGRAPPDSTKLKAQPSVQ